MITFTKKAQEKVSQYVQANQEYKGKHLRIYIQGGGCQGYQYGFAFDIKRDLDHQVSMNQEFSAIIDPKSMPLLKGSTIDYVDTLQQSGFTVNNPNARETCGCGTSFASDNKEDANFSESSTCSSSQGGCC